MRKALLFIATALFAVSCSGVLDENPSEWDSFATKSNAPEDNNPPSVTTDYVGEYVVHAHETLTIDIYVSDPDGDPFVVSFDGGSSAASNKKIADGHYQFRVVGNGASDGVYVATYVAMDVWGDQQEYNIGYEISPNHAPEVVKDVESRLFKEIGATFTVDASEHVTDPDGESLKYTWKMSSKGLVDIKMAGSVLTGKIYNYGRTDIVITATDEGGLSVDLPFAVLCRRDDSGISVYPNPVRPDENGHCYLYVCGGDPAKTRIEVFSASGSLAWSNEVVSSVFQPAVVDMSNFASGKYNVVVFMNGELYTRSIMKL